jgi:hypothetical protein
VDLDDRAPRLGIRQVDEEDLVEAALAQEFGRQLRHVVGGRDGEDISAAVLQPGQERAEHAL